jgi:hypothetical protein
MNVLKDELDMDDVEAAKKIRWATYVLAGRDPDSG